MRCPKCGAENQVGSRFCSQCGSPLPAMGDTTKVIPAMTEELMSMLELDPREAEAVRQLDPGSALLIIHRGSGAGSRYLIDTDVTSIGRHPDSDIFLDDITVSRHHAKLVRSGDAITVEDLGSLNGTYVNRTLIDGSAQLRMGDEVQVGKYRMMYFMGERGVS